MLIAYVGASTSHFNHQQKQDTMNVIASAISDIPNVKNISDDVIIYGVTVQEHDKAPHAVLTCFQKLNLALRKDKCQFYMPWIEFFGFPL